MRYGSQSLTWENFFIGEDTNTPVNAQMRLYENGDFTTSSNDLVTVCRRVEPFDGDGDGLANTDEAMRGGLLPRELPDGTMTLDLNFGAWSDGLLVWDIPWGWATSACDSGATPVKLMTPHYNQSFAATEVGTLSVMKFGNTVSRGTNNVIRLNGVVADGYPYLEDFSDE